MRCIAPVKAVWRVTFLGRRLFRPKVRRQRLHPAHLERLFSLASRYGLAMFTPCKFVDLSSEYPRQLLVNHRPARSAPDNKAKKDAVDVDLWGAATAIRNRIDDILRPGQRENSAIAITFNMFRDLFSMACHDSSTALILCLAHNLETLIFATNTIWDCSRCGRSCLRLSMTRLVSSHL
jgi:hypothetical protein